MSRAPRILLSGDVRGRLNQLYKRFHTVNKASGPFDVLLCVGQFFPDDYDGLVELSEYLDGRLQIPIPTYFTGDYGAGAVKTLMKVLKLKENQGFKTDGVRVCDNLYWLKGSGKFVLHGLLVAYLSGRSQPESEGHAIGVYNDDDIGALRALVEDTEIIDIFLTNEWPTGVWNRADTSGLPEGFFDSLGSDVSVANLVAEIKPRYHIAGSKNIYFSREPYSNNKVIYTTRFLGLAAVGNKDKQKFIHAISPAPASTMSPADLCVKPPNTTLSPYIIDSEKSAIVDPAKRQIDANSDSQYWRFSVSGKRQKHADDGSERLCFKFTSTGSCLRGNKCNFCHDEVAREQYIRNVCFDFLNKGKCERGPGCNFKHSLCEEGENFSGGRSKFSKSSSYRHGPEKNCWFCLSSPDVESHLVTCIGESCYCAFAKGPLVQDHILLIPIDHCPNTFSMSPEKDAELGRFKRALRHYFKNLRKTAVFYEFVSQKTSHANLQVVPIPLSRAADAQRAFMLAAKRLGFEFEVLNTGNEHTDFRKLLRSQFDKNSNFFYVELPDGEVLKHSVQDQERFPIQFGREVLAGMLNLADRADWRNCRLSKEEEIKMVEDFRKGFEEFNPAQ